MAPNCAKRNGPGTMETASPHNGVGDLPRLRATLGDPRLARLVARLRRRLEQGLPLTGSLTLTRATAGERAATDELIGRRPTSGEAVRIDLDALAGALRAAGICDDLAGAMAVLHGPIANRRAADLERKAAWAGLWRETGAAFANRPAIAGWLGELAQSGIVKRLCGDDPKRARATMADWARVVNALPVAAEPLAALAARLFGDAHALDPGGPCATLAVRAAARIGGVPFEDDAEGRRAAWASAGVMCDELSTPALVFNLTAQGDAPLARLLRSATREAEPLHVSLRWLLRWPLGTEAEIGGTKVFVCENPTIVALAASRLGRACAPLVCVNGQFATPALVLLRQLREAGAQLFYHGDFDPAGLAIARRVMAESGARPWRFDATDYAAAPKGVAFSGLPGPTPWDPALSDLMRRDGRAVHEEAVFSTLAGDLSRAHPPG
jgi:uncharacterized protein (TIGR02679 family)